MSLQMLKEELQSVLNDSTESLYFRIAVEDAQYACALGSEAALLNWANNWSTDDYTSLPEDDLEYQRGVQFVQELWEEIK